MKNFFIKLYKFSSSWTGTIVIVLFVVFFLLQAFVIPSGSMKNTLLVGDFLFVKKFSYGIPTPTLPWIEQKVLPDFRGNGHLFEGERPKRGDIVVFRYPLNEKQHFVKREFAVGGDEVIASADALYLRPHEGDEFIQKTYPKSKIVILNGQKYVKNPYEYLGIHYDETIDIFSIMVNEYLANRFAMRPILVDNFSKFEGLNFNAFYVKVPQDEFFMIGDNRNNSRDSRFWGSIKYRHVVGTPWIIYFSWDQNYKIRWNRVGRFVSTVQDNESYIKEAVDENKKLGLH